GLRADHAGVELELYYQPKVDIDSGHVTGAEALIRWNHPDWGLVSPIRFIPILEKGDLIVPVGEWVLREACAACSRLHAAGHEDLRIAVNLSPRQFLESNIVAMVERCLKEHSLAPRFIELEITEALLVQDVVRVSETLKSLKRLGVTIAVDDFGTGYSSLSYLTEFTLDTLKIDQAFIRNVENDKKSAAITSTIQAMAKSMELTVVAEGVENEAQLDFLRSLGCVTAQGYYYAKPLPEAAFRDWLRAQPAPQGPAPHCGP
ncbi:putative bifunctional diguanylate cyclase/phosphodiesterase, partial [Desulfobaculum sp.]